MALQQTHTDRMPDAVRQEYRELLERLDHPSARIESPDPAYARQWVGEAEARLGIGPREFRDLSDADRLRVRNTILESLIVEAYNDRRGRDPYEDEETSWHLAVKRGVEGYVSYEAAKHADRNRDQTDAWGSLDAFLPGVLASRERIVGYAEMAELKDRETANREVDAFLATAAVRLQAIYADPAEFVALTALRRKLGESRPSDAVLERFRHDAGVPGKTDWNQMTDRQRDAFVFRATEQIVAEELCRVEMAQVARPYWMSEAEHFAARRGRALAAAESYYRTGIRVKIEGGLPGPAGPTGKSDVPRAGDGGAITLEVPTAKDAAPVLADLRGRSESIGMSEAVLSDRARLETFYRRLLADVAGVTDPKVRAELERRVPQLRNLTDGAVSITAIDRMARDGKLTLDSGMQQYIGSSLGLGAAESADLGGYLRREAAEAARARQGVESGVVEVAAARPAPVREKAGVSADRTTGHAAERRADISMGM